MTIVKHLKDSSSQRLPKKQSPYWIKNMVNLIPSLLLASLLGTYLDLFFIGKGLYSFPIRPMSSIFSINIAFTLIGLPLVIGVFLYVCNKINFLQKVGLIIIFSLLMAVVEKLAEAVGLFVHVDGWKHLYSFYGYIIYLSVIYTFFHWSKRTLF
ncbi:CBO0543 family protein [Bacillus seohaeanensis]|uniref:CBO0543 family protein n=1 Tax=Bacillus seohaeanensis TaxID=284580 RepID=A0ABW5RU89_9BACI